MTPPRRRTSARPPSNPSPWHGLTDADLACPGHDPADARIRQVVAEVAQPLHALGTTADGSPRHPSRLPVDAPLVRWPT